MTNDRNSSSPMTRNVPGSPAVGKLHYRTQGGLVQRARMRAKLINVAIKVFAEKGPHAPVIGDFVNAAKISRGTFYYYFSTVGELLDATADVVNNESIREICPVVENLSNPIIRFTTAIRLYHRRLQSDTVFAAFVNSVNSLGSLVDDNVRRDLREAVAQGLVRIQDVEVAYVIAVGASRYAATYASVPGHERLDTIALVRAILNSWGVEHDLIDQALSLPLPKITYRALI